MTKWERQALAAYAKRNAPLPHVRLLDMHVEAVISALLRGSGALRASLAFD